MFNKNTKKVHSGMEVPKVKNKKRSKSVKRHPKRTTGKVNKTTAQRTKKTQASRKQTLKSNKQRPSGRKKQHVIRTGLSESRAVNVNHNPQSMDKHTEKPTVSLKNVPKELKNEVIVGKDGLVHLSWRSNVTDFIDNCKHTFKTVIFRRSILLLFAVLCLAFGLTQSFHHYHREQMLQAMRVSPINTVQQFSVSNTQITFLRQYRYADTYALPFTIADMSVMSSNANDYEVQIQGISQQLSKKLKVKLYMFGSTGRGVILIKGDLPSVPMRVYLQANKALSTNVSTDVDTDDSSGSDASSSSSAIGQMTVGSKVIKTKDDVVNVQINPSAKNVRKARGISFDSSSSTLYKITVGNSDLHNIETNKKALRKQMRQLDYDIKEYENRLAVDNAIKDDAKKAIVAADNIAKKSNGNQVDLDKINKILTDAKATSDYDDSDSSDDVSNMSKSEMNSQLKKQVDLSQYGKSSGSSEVDALSQLRTNYMTLNQNMAIYNYQRDGIMSIINSQNSDATSAQKFKILLPF